MVTVLCLLANLIIVESQDVYYNIRQTSLKVTFLKSLYLFHFKLEIFTEYYFIILKRNKPLTFL